MKRQQKLYSCGDAATRIGCSRDWLQKACRDDKLGKRQRIGTDRQYFVISEKEIAAMETAKTQGKTLSEAFRK